MQRYIYPAVKQPLPQLSFNDQFCLLACQINNCCCYSFVSHCMHDLSTNQYVQFVHVFYFDFSKAFDMVRHVTLRNKTEQTQIPDNTYNQTKDFFDQHHHCMQYAGHSSVAKSKTVSYKAQDMVQCHAFSWQQICIQ